MISKQAHGESRDPRADAPHEESYLDEIYPASDTFSAPAKTPPRSAPRQQPAEETQNDRGRRSERDRRSGIPSLHGHLAHNSTTIIIETEPLIYPRRESLGLRPRFGAMYAAMADAAMFNVGFGLSYTFHPQVMLDLRGDFQMPVLGVDYGPLLSTAWLSLNVVYYFYARSFVQPYLIGGVSLAIAPGDEQRGIEGVVAGGGQAGLGVELLLLHQRLGVSFEAVGMIAGYEGQILEGGVTFTTALSVYL